jgi:hypothetical protein
VEIGVLKANAVVIILQLANIPYQDLMVFCASFGEFISNLDVFQNVDWKLVQHTK